MSLPDQRLFSTQGQETEWPADKKLASGEWESGQLRLGKVHVYFRQGEAAREKKKQAFMLYRQLTARRSRSRSRTKQ